MERALFLVVLLALAGCSNLFISHRSITADQQALIDNPPPDLAAEVEKYVPDLVAYNIALEDKALRNGRPLNDLERIDARAIGIDHPERVRIYTTDDIPGGDRATLLSEVGAVTAGYGIYIRPHLTYSRGIYREIIVHEFAHVRQFERLGTEAMARRTLVEYTVLGNVLVPLEREAIAIGEAVYDDPGISYGY